MYHLTCTNLNDNSIVVISEFTFSLLLYIKEYTVNMTRNINQNCPQESKIHRQLIQQNKDKKRANLLHQTDSEESDGKNYGQTKRKLKATKAIVYKEHVAVL